MIRVYCEPDYDQEPEYNYIEYNDLFYKMPSALTLEESLAYIKSGKMKTIPELPTNVYEDVDSSEYITQKDFENGN